tara:strand:- start:6719 stop:7801 length:1083 start_codon:yes stop_codon:yes gene_type:complete
MDTNAEIQNDAPDAVLFDIVAVQRIAIVTDAWFPQINGVVRVLDSVRKELIALGHSVQMITPDRFRTVPCPSYPEIPLALFPGRKMSKILFKAQPTAIHIATEGPLGLAVRRWCLRRNVPFTTAYHTKFPEYVHARTRLPLSWLYWVMRRFHGPSSNVLTPSPSVYRELTAHGFRNAKEWAHGVNAEIFWPREKSFLSLPRPIHLFIGRTAVEKNLPAFLSLDLPGSKVVVGDGPQRNELIKTYPDAHFFIATGDDELARYYSAADVFVFPSRTDTFGLTMLESLACGVPVAAFPVTGPLDVLGMNQAGETGFGCLNPDLSKAAHLALGKSADACRAHALGFSWNRVAKEFLAALAPIPV